MIVTVLLLFGAAFHYHDDSTDTQNEQATKQVERQELTFFSREGIG